ncbi:MAG: ATP-binding protein [Altererythrobacter ishigakiensis]|nr:ATP-binding protein [Altererythrobacter ishigakiensis]
MASLMEGGQHHPVSGIFIALAASLALLLIGLDWLVVLVILFVWIGSLYLASERPPVARPKSNGRSISREYMGELIEHAATPLLVIEGGRIATANREAQRILGKHIIGQDARMAFRQPQAIKLLGKNRSGAAIVRGLVRRRDIWRINRQKIDDDLSVLELINRTAEADMSRAHTDFVANASHELRTPLASIIGYVETLQEDPGSLDTETANKFLGTILREARRLQSLVSDLMSLSRVEAEKHDQPSDIIELNTLVERAARDAAGANRSERLKFEFSGDFQIRGDEQQIEQLVRNLVDNALKYGHQDTDVTVELRETRDGQVRFSVSDQGDGIAPEHLPHLTRRFYRTDPGRSRASGGTGLGLAIVKHIVERHRGRLDIESKLGEGTTFIVRIPALANEADGLS